MQEIDTWTAAGWRDSDSFAHYVQSKMMMKEAMDAAHARGMIIRPVTNSILRLAQMPEALLEARIAAALPAAAGPARKAGERSKQRDALALLVRRLVKRSMRVNAVEAQHVDGNANPPNAAQISLYTNGALSSICMRKLTNVDVLYEGTQEHNRNVTNGVADTWENAPYYMARAQHGQAAGAQHEHDIGITAHYIENLLLPGRHALRKDINAVMAFSATTDGRDFVPVGIFVYGICNGTVESSRHMPGSNPALPEHAQRFAHDYIHFVPKAAADLENIALPEHPNLFNGNAPAPIAPAVNNANQLAVIDHGVYYQQYNAAPANFHPSELQHRIYDGRIAEVFVVCAQDPLDLHYQRERAAAVAALGPGAGAAAVAAAIAGIRRPTEHMGGWGSLLLAFGISFIATERKSIEEAGVKSWIPQYAGVVMELAPDAELVVEAAGQGPAAGRAQREQMATRGTQSLRNIARRMGFTSQPIIKTDVSIPGVPGAAAGDRVPQFANTNIGVPWQRINNEYVSLYTPGRDYFELSRIGRSLPAQIKAENNEILGRVIADGAQPGICPSVRGMGIVKCS